LENRSLQKKLNKTYRKSWLIAQIALHMKCLRDAASEFGLNMPASLRNASEFRRLLSRDGPWAPMNSRAKIAYIKRARARFLAGTETLRSSAHYNILDYTGVTDTVITAAWELQSIIDVHMD
jgi:hypothetical protein